MIKKRILEKEALGEELLALLVEDIGGEDAYKSAVEDIANK